MNIVALAKQKNSHLSDWETEFFWNGIMGGGIMGGVQGCQVTKDNPLMCRRRDQDREGEEQVRKRARLHGANSA